MKTRYLISTAVGLVFATAVLAQSPSSTTTAPAAQTPAPSTSAPATQKAPDATNSQAPAVSTTTAPNTSTGAAQAQSTAPASPGGTSQPAQAQTGIPAPATGQAPQAPAQAQQAPASGTANTTAQQPATPANTAQSSSTNVHASVNINDQQRTRVTESITRLNVQPINNVNFSLTVGTAVPRDIRLQTLPADVVEVVPQYRGYSFFVVRDEIVIVEPSSYQIVTVLPRSGGATAAAPAHSKVSFTDKDRDVVRKHVKTRTIERQTTGSTARVVIRRGEPLPESVEFEEFPETVYREAPSLREYRYVHRENRTYLVDPRERRVIEEID